MICGEGTEDQVASKLIEETRRQRMLHAFIQLFLHPSICSIWYYLLCSCSYQDGAIEFSRDEATERVDGSKCETIVTR